MRRVYIQISDQHLKQLTEVAEREHRDPRKQATYMLEQAIEKAYKELQDRQADA